MSEPFGRPFPAVEEDAWALPVGFSFVPDGSLLARIGHPRLHRTRKGPLCFELTYSQDRGYALVEPGVTMPLITGQTFPASHVEAKLEPLTDTLWAQVHANSIQGWMEALWAALVERFPSKTERELHFGLINAWLHPHGQAIRLLVEQPPMDREQEALLRDLSALGF